MSGGSGSWDMTSPPEPGARVPRSSEDGLRSRKEQPRPAEADSVLPADPAAPSRTAAEPTPWAQPGAAAAVPPAAKITRPVPATATPSLLSTEQPLPRAPPARRPWGRKLPHPYVPDKKACPGNDRMSDMRSRKGLSCGRPAQAIVTTSSARQPPTDRTGRVIADEHRTLGKAGPG